MAARQTRAEQLHDHRLAMERAIRDHLTLTEARIVLAKERWAATNARLVAAQCGTRAPASDTDTDTDTDTVAGRPRWFTETEGDWAP